MATIIDSLVVELGLDASKFDAEQKKAVNSLRQFEQQASKHAGGAQESFDKFALGLKEVQGRLLAIGALIAAGLGFNRLIQDTTKLTSELGYMSKQIGVSAQEFSKWQIAGATVGATAQDIGASFAVIQKSMADMQLGKGSFLHEFARTTHVAGQGPAVELYDQNGQSRKSSDILLDISRWYSAQKDKNVATRLMEQIGFGKGMINMIGLGPDELQKRLKEAEQFAPSDDQIKKFQALQEQFGKLVEVVQALSRAFAEKLAPVLTKILTIINDILTKFYGGSNPADMAGNALASGGMNELTPNASKPGIFAGTWNWLRGKGWYGNRGSSGGQAAPSDLTPTEQQMMNMVRPGGGTGTGGASAAVGEGSSAYLRDRRQRYMDEINNTPGLRERVGGMLQLEGTPQASMEALLNRMDYVNSERQSRGLPPITIDQMLTSGFYGPINNGRLPEGVAAYRQNPNRLDAAMNRAFGGSHSIGGFTDQGLPTDPNGWRQPQARIGSNVFPDWNGGSRFSAGDYRNAAAYRRRVEEALERERAGATGSPAAGPIDPAASRSFDHWRNLGLGPQGALSRGNTSNVSNNSSTSTHIGELNVTVPPGSDPSAYGDGIRQELRRFDNVQQANTGLR